MGRERLSDRVRRPASALGPLRRHPRAEERLHGRPRRLHGGIPAMRARPEPGGAGRGSLRPGRRRRNDLRGDPRDDRDDVPRAAGAGEGDRRVRLRRLRRRVGRIAGRRRADRIDQLALDLLRQHPDRDRHRAARLAPARSRRGDRLRRRGRRARRRPDHQLADARRLHDRLARRRGRLGRGVDARPRRRLARPARGLHRPRGEDRQSADPAADLPLAQRLGRKPDSGALGRGDFRDVLPRLPLHGAGARLHAPWRSGSPSSR